MALHAFLWPFHAQLSATRLACIPLSSSLQRQGCMKISAVQEYSEASGSVRDDGPRRFAWRQRWWHRQTESGSSHRAAFRLPNESLSSNKAKKYRLDKLRKRQHESLCQQQSQKVARRKVWVHKITFRLCVDQEPQKVTNNGFSHAWRHFWEQKCDIFQAFAIVWHDWIILHCCCMRFMIWVQTGRWQAMFLVSASWKVDTFFNDFFFAVLFCIVWTMNKCKDYMLWLSICVLIKKQDNMLKNMEVLCLCVKSMC